MNWLKLACASLLGIVGLALLFATVKARQADCETDNYALRAMPFVQVQFTRADGSNFEFKAKLADNIRSRAAGFQKVCASTIKRTPMLFVFQHPVIPRFHMNNVVAPLEIAFIDANGGIESIQSMKVYDLTTMDRPLYGAGRPIIAALETDPEFFSRHQLSLSSTVSWTPLDNSAP